jgi:hypothetical protein
MAPSLAFPAFLTLTPNHTTRPPGRQKVLKAQRPALEIIWRFFGVA